MGHHEWKGIREPAHGRDTGPHDRVDPGRRTVPREVPTVCLERGGDLVA